MTIDTWFSTLSAVNLFGGLHAIAQALLLALSRRGNRRANRVMAIFLLALAVGMANGFLNLLGWYDRWPVLSIVIGSVVLTYSPLFYLYIRAMTGDELRWQPSRLGHGVPFFFGLAAWTAFWLFRENGAIPGILAGLVRSPWVPVTFMVIVQMAVYVTLMIRCLREYSRRIKDSYSSLDDVNLRWLKRRLAVFVAISIAGLAVLAALAYDRRLVNVTGQIAFFLVALNVFAIGYGAMLQPRIFFGPDDGSPGRRYQRSTLTAEGAAFLKDRLLGLMERERPFLDAKITLPGLAKSLDAPAAHLSQVINETLSQNFFDFINRYRIEAAKERLSRNGAEQVKMITVAFDCGFNSVATFNRVFKELTGQTPSAYRLHPRRP